MRPIYNLIVVFLALLIVITAVFKSKVPDAYPILATYAVLLTALTLLISLQKRNNSKLVEMTCDIIFPVAAVMLIFNSLGGLVHNINSLTYDHVLIRLDYMLFGMHPTVALERFTTPVLTEILQFAYASYYFLPVILGVTLKMEGKEAEFHRSVFLIILCFFLSYIGYILVPALGPRYTLNHLQSVELHGIFLRDVINDTLNSLEGIKLDAFPSGHTAVTLTVVYLAYRFQKTLLRIFLPLALALVISTVYLRYHYVVDVLAGILLFMFTIYIGEKYYNWWERKNSSHAKEWSSLFNERS